VHKTPRNPHLDTVTSFGHQPSFESFHLFGFIQIHGVVPSTLGGLGVAWHLLQLSHAVRRQRRLLVLHPFFLQSSLVRGDGFFVRLWDRDEPHSTDGRTEPTWLSSLPSRSPSNCCLNFVYPPSAISWLPTSSGTSRRGPSSSGCSSPVDSSLMITSSISTSCSISSGLSTVFTLPLS
jgi:hypothetical protein